MLLAPYRAAVIGRTGKGDYGHGMDVAFVGNPKLQVVAVADDDSAGRAAAAKRIGVSNAYADYREMLDREKPQFVAVAPRWIDEHRAMILACAERGIHVLCEKPLAPTLADCDAIVAACERTHTKLAIAFQTRYSPRYERIKELIAGGAIGEILELRGRGKEDRRGGGEDLMVLGSHIMDLFRGVMGEAAWCFARATEGGRPIDRTDARQGPEGLGPIAGDRIDAMFGFQGKAPIAHFATSRPKQVATRFGLHILGSEGRILLETGWLPPAYLLRDPTWKGVSDRAKWTEITSAGPGQPEKLSGGNQLGEANKAIVADLIHAVESDTQPRTCVYAARSAIEMILSCYASHLRGGVVNLPLEDRAKHPLASDR